MTQKEKCDCELPGFFCSGVPGIVAHTVDGKLPNGAEVQRCDLCERFKSDAAAREYLLKTLISPLDTTATCR